MNEPDHQPDKKISVSIIIPVWNTGKYLTESVESALRELNGESGEVIIVDDNSDDSFTLKILESLSKDPRTKVLVNSTGIKGAGSARNFGVQHAHGDWLLFLDSDDVLIEGSLTDRLRVIAAHPQLQWMSADFYSWYPPKPLHGNGYFADRLESYESVRVELETKTPIVKKSPVVRLFTDRMPAHTLVVMLRKDLFMAVGGFSTYLQKAEDTFLWINLAHSEVPFAFYPFPVGKYRIRAESLTHEDKASGHWKAELFKAFYYDKKYARYKLELKARIAKAYISDCNYYRKKAQPWGVLKNAFRAMSWNPKNLQAWKHILIGVSLAATPEK